MKKVLRVKKINAGVYIAAFTVIASSLLLILMIGMMELGFLHPRKEKLIIQTETLEKLYDGLPLVGENYEIIYGKLFDGHSIKILSKSSQTLIGESINHMEFIIRDTSGADVSELYDIEQRSGTLKIANRSVSIRLASQQKVYDGTPLSDDSWEIVSPQGFAEGHTAVIFDTPEITEVGKIENNGIVKILDADGKDVGSQYVLTVEKGTLEISPRSLTVLTNSATKYYDGTPLTEQSWSLTGGRLSDGHRLDVICTAQITEVGEIDNTASCVIYDALGADVSDQYDVIFRPGKLTVQSKTLYISTGSAEKIYDGTPLTNRNWQITSGILGEGDTIEVIGGTEMRDVGNITNHLTFVIRDASGRDITSRYDVHLVYGSLRVEPRKISIQTGSAQKKYDGSPLFNDTWTLISGSLCAGQELSVVGTRRTAVGSSENMPISYAIYQHINDVQIDVTDCYQITFSNGMLTVAP